MNIALGKITLEGMNELDRDFQRDPATFADMSLFSAYRYSPEETRKRFERYGAPDRRHFLIRLDGRPVGETGIKHIDWGEAGGRAFHPSPERRGEKPRYRHSGGAAFARICL